MLTSVKHINDVMNVHFNTGRIQLPHYPLDITGNVMLTSTQVFMQLYILSLPSNSCE